MLLAGAGHRRAHTCVCGLVCMGVLRFAGASGMLEGVKVADLVFWVPGVVCWPGSAPSFDYVLSMWSPAVVVEARGGTWLPFPVLVIVTNPVTPAMICYRRDRCELTDDCAVARTGSLYSSLASDQVTHRQNIPLE